MRKMRLTEAKYEDFYSGPRPKFTMSVIKKKNVGKKLEDKTPSSSTSSTPKTTNTAVPSSSSKNNSPSGKLKLYPAMFCASTCSSRRCNVRC